MKNMKSMFIIAMMTLFTTFVKAQEAGTAELKVKTSAICEECKARIEKDLAFEKGVKKSTLDLETKIVTVTYNPEKTTPEKIREAIANIGYDADKVMANQRAFNKLPKCCQKPMDSY
jgi:periplasmic mercuric ion binding protein